MRSDHDGEFENHAFEIFYEENGFKHEFLTSRTPQQNKVIKRKNHSL